MMFRLLHYVVQRRTVVSRVTLVFLIAALAYVIVSGRKYEVSTLLLPPVEEGGEGILSVWMQNLNLPSVVAPVSAGVTSAAILGDMLGSRRLGETIINDLSLKEHFKTKSLDDALRELRGRTSTTVTETGLISLSVTDRDPQYALMIARAYIAELDSLSLFLQYSRAGETREFIAGQLEKYREQLKTARQKLAVFQKKQNIVDFDEQVRGAIDVAADLKVRAVLAGIDRDLVREFTNSNSAELRRKSAEFNDLTQQLENIMNGDSSGAVFVPLNRVPELVQKHAEMQRDIEVNERVYSYLLERYEEVCIEKARTMSVVQVVDKPVLPEKPAGMSRWLIVVIITSVGFLWITCMIMWWGWVQGREKSSDEERALADLASTVRGDIAWLRRKLHL
jgi:uncharacterized protein involved in exopolysaccharide biosynthesis